MTDVDWGRFVVRPSASGFLSEQAVEAAVEILRAVVNDAVVNDDRAQQALDVLTGTRPFDVVFRYADDDDTERIGQRETRSTEAEARAFADGLTWGDEPKYEVDEIAECRYPAMHKEVKP